MNRVAFVVLFFLTSFRANSTMHADSLFLEANQRYSKQYYGEARGLYDQLISKGYEHTDLYYNIGNTYYQLGELGNAIWAYEKGLILSPRDNDLNFNLSVVNARIIDRVIVPEPVFILKLYGSIKQTLSPPQWLYLISFLILGTSIFSTIARMWKNRLSKLFLNFSSFGLVLVVVFFIIFVDSYLDLSNSESGVVIAKEGRVYAAPSHSSNLLFMIHEGTKAEVSNRQYPWIEIQLIDGKKGWLSSNQLRLL